MPLKPRTRWILSRCLLSHVRSRQQARCCQYVQRAHQDLPATTVAYNHSCRHLPCTPAYRPRVTCIPPGALSPSDTHERVVSFSLEICTRMKGSFEGITRICKGVVLCHGLDRLYTRYPRVSRGLKFRRRFLTWQRRSHQSGRRLDSRPLAA